MNLYLIQSCKRGHFDIDIGVFVAFNEPKKMNFANFAKFAKLGAKYFAFREIMKTQKISNTIQNGASLNAKDQDKKTPI